MKSVLLAGKAFQKHTLGIQVQRNSHLLESTLVLTASSMARKEKMCQRTTLGRLLKHLLFGSMPCSSFSFCLLGFWIREFASIFKRFPYIPNTLSENFVEPQWVWYTGALGREKFPAINMSYYKIFNITESWPDWKIPVIIKWNKIRW
jgi:hypothetical protein